MNDQTWHARMLSDLVVAGLAERTCEAYLRAVRQLSRFYDGCCPSELSKQQVKDYLLWLRVEKRAAAGTLKIAIGGLRFFYRQTCPRDWTVLDKFRIPPERRLPTVLSSGEVRRIMNAFRRERFRVYFWTVYSCGLRLNEALALQVGDVDSQRMRIHVHRGKAAKDRLVPLPESTFDVLREYWKQPPPPTEREDEGLVGGSDQSIRRCCFPRRLTRSTSSPARGRRCMSRPYKPRCGGSSSN